jgi:hypothetical protein
MGFAFTRAKEAMTELSKNPREKHVDALVKDLFGNDNAKLLTQQVCNQEAWYSSEELTSSSTTRGHPIARCLRRYDNSL